MSTGIGIKIQNDKVVLTAMYDQVLKTVRFPLRFAERAWTVLVPAKVFVAVAVYMIHSTILS